MSSTKNIVKIVMRLECHLWKLRIKLGLILTPEEHHKLYLQERNLSPNSVIVVTQKLVLQQSKKVRAKCTEIPTPPPCILYLLVIKTIFTL